MSTGNTGSNENAISEEALDEYVELTYLSKSETHQCIYSITCINEMYVNEQFEKYSKNVSKV